VYIADCVDHLCFVQRFLTTANPETVIPYLFLHTTVTQNTDSGSDHARSGAI